MAVAGQRTTKKDPVAQCRLLATRSERLEPRTARCRDTTLCLAGCHSPCIPSPSSFVCFFPFLVLFFPSFLRHVFTLLYLVERLQPSSRELKSSRRVWAMRHIRRTKLGGRFSRIPERAASPFAAQGIEIHGPSLASTGIPRFTRRSGPPRAEKEHTPPHSGTAARFVGYFRSVSFPAVSCCFEVEASKGCDIRRRTNSPLPYVHAATEAGANAMNDS